MSDIGKKKKLTVSAEETLDLDGDQFFQKSAEKNENRIKKRKKKKKIKDLL